MTNTEGLLAYPGTKLAGNGGYSPLGIGGANSKSAVTGLPGLPGWASGALPTGIGMLGKALNIPSIVTSPLAALAKGLNSTELQFGARPDNQLSDSVLNATLKAALSAAVPGAGIPLSILGMMGLNIPQGIRDWTSPDYDSKKAMGYSGGFFGDASWRATNGEANLPGNYSGSGYGNTSGPGSGAGYTPSPTNGGANLPGNYSGSGYGNTYGPGSGAGNATGDSDY